MDQYQEVLLLLNQIAETLDSLHSRLAEQYPTWAESETTGKKYANALCERVSESLKLHQSNVSDQSLD